MFCSSVLNLPHCPSVATVSLIGDSVVGRGRSVPSWGHVAKKGQTVAWKGQRTSCTKGTVAGKGQKVAEGGQDEKEGWSDEKRSPPGPLGWASSTYNPHEEFDFLFVLSTTLTTPLHGLFLSSALRTIPQSLQQIKLKALIQWCPLDTTMTPGGSSSHMKSCAQSWV